MATELLGMLVAARKDHLSVVDGLVITEKGSVNLVQQGVMAK